jgi:hypothetical protein
MKEFEDATPDDVLPAPSVEGPSSLSAHDGAATSRAPAGVHFEPRFQVVTRLPQGLLHVIRQQYKLMEAWLEPLWRTSARQGDDIQRLRTAMEGVSLSYKNALAELEKMKQEKTAE